MELVKDITKEDLELYSKFNDLDVAYTFYFDHPDKNGKLKANISGNVNDELLKTFWLIEEKYNENIKGKWFEDQIVGIDINFSSKGGLCYTGLEIVDFIRLWNENHKAKINFKAQGIVASAGIFIFLMGKYRTASVNAHFMIHELYSSIEGRLTKMKDYVYGDQQLQEIINKIIIERTSINEEKIKEIMKRDYFFTPQEALEMGIIHEIV